MTNLEKLKKVVEQLTFMIGEGLIDEDCCGTIYEEVESTIEILRDCGIDI